MPALIVAGASDREDFWIGAHRLAERLASARCATLADAGHLAPLEPPAAFRALLLDFLRGPAEAGSASGAWPPAPPEGDGR